MTTLNSALLSLVLCGSLLGTGCGDDTSQGERTGEVDGGRRADGGAVDAGAAAMDAGDAADSGVKDDASTPAMPSKLGQACVMDSDCASNLKCGFDVSFVSIPGPNGRHSACTSACTGDASCDATTGETNTACLTDPGSPCVKKCEQDKNCPAGTFCNEREFCEVIERTGVKRDPALGTLGMACKTDKDCNSQFTCGFDINFAGVPGPNGFHSACVAKCTGDAQCTATARESDTVCLADPGDLCVKSCFDHADVCPTGTYCNERKFCEVIGRR